MSHQRTIGEAIASDLSAHTYAGSITEIEAVYRRRPDYQLEDLGELKVSVVPGPIQHVSAGQSTFGSGMTRGSDALNFTFGIVVAKHVGSEADMQELEDLNEQILDLIRSHLLPLAAAPAGIHWIDFSQPMPFDPEALGDRSVFMSQIEVTYSVSVDRIVPPAG
jgi:hypothetical protein